MANNLFIFSFNQFEIISILSVYLKGNIDQIIFFIIQFLLIVTIWFLRKKIDSKFHKTLLILLILWTGRLILFGNPLSWYIYLNMLTPDDIGWRQIDVITYEYNKFRKKRENKYFAIGSSQTAHIYVSGIEPNFHSLSLAGLSSFELYTYRDVIKGKSSEYVLLYLSEFDLARKPNLEKVITDPRQGFDLFVTIPKLFPFAKKSNSLNTIKEIVISDLILEYKYSFIFKGLLNKLSKKNKAMNSVNKKLVQQKSLLDFQLKSLSKLDETYFQFNFFFLEKFLEYCYKNSMKIIIIEGQYHPKAYTKKNQILNKLVNKKLLEISDLYSNVKFLNKKQTYIFRESDYKDGYHVNKKAGEAFTKRIFEILKDSSFKF